MSDNIKNLFFDDRVSYKDEKKIIDPLAFDTSGSKSAKFKTEIIAKNELGEVLWTDHNELLLSGGMFLFSKLTNVNPPIDIQTVNLDLGVLTSETDPGYTGPRREQSILGFMVGVGGCTDVFDTVKDVKYKERQVISPVPFRKVLKTADLDSSTKSKYGMRVTNGSYYDYYIKLFETAPVIHAEFDEPGYPAVPANVDTDPGDRVINTYVQFTLKVTKDDLREYFKLAGGGINKARINTLALVYGYPDNSLGYTEYKGVRLFSKLNFNNEPLDNETKEINIIYKIYV